MPAIIKTRHCDQIRPWFCITQGKIMKRKAREQRPLCMCQQTANAWQMEKWTMSKTHSPAETVQPAHSTCITGSVKHAQSKSKATRWFSWQCSDCTCRFRLTLLTLLLKAALLLCPATVLICRLTAGWIYCANTLIICISWIIHYPKTLRRCDLYLHKGPGPGKRSPCPWFVGVPKCCPLWLETCLPRQPMYCLYLSIEPVKCQTVMLSLSFSLSISCFCFFWSLLFLSHLIMRYLHCHRQQKVIFLCPAFPSLLPHYHPLDSVFRIFLQNCAFCVYWVYFQHFFVRS